MTLPSASTSARPVASKVIPAGRPRSDSGPAPAVSAEPGRRGAWIPPLLVAGVGLFLSVLDQTITGVANSAIQKDFGGSNVDIQWVTTSYRLGQGIMVPLGVWACRRYGLRRMYVVALVLYMVTSLLCTTAQSLTGLVVFRFLQGVPGGLASIVSIAVVAAVLPRDKQALGQALLMSVVLAAPGFSPALGGFFVEYLNWRFVFIVTIPIALLGLLATAALLPELPGGGAGRFDWGGFLCLATGLVCLLLATSKGSDWGWSSYVILILFAVGVDALILFVIIERQVEEPLLNLRMFTSQPYVLGCLLVVLIITALSTVPVFLPQYLQQVQSLTPTGTGLVLLPQALCLVIAVPIAGVLTRTVGPRWPMIAGLVVLGCASLYLNRLADVDLPRPMLVEILGVRAFGLGLAMVPALGATVAVLPPALMADGIVFRTVFQRVGSELVTLVLIAHSAHRQQQILVDRSQLLGPNDAPTLHALQRMNQASLLPLFQKQQVYDLAEAYGEVFQIVGVLMLVGVVLAVVGRWGERLPTEKNVMENGV